MKKTRHIIVRITETQFKWLADALISEQRNKSSIIREALDKYMDEPSRSTNKQIRKNIKNRKPMDSQEISPGED